MSGRIAFVDTETTSLELPGLPESVREFSSRIWEVGAYLLDKPNADKHLWVVRREDLDLEHADPEALEIGRFHERHPQGDRFEGNQTKIRLLSEKRAMEEIADVLGGRAVLLGSHPGFDMVRLEFRMRIHGIRPGWHYHPDDIPSMIKGWLSAKGIPLPEKRSSENLSRAVGVDPKNYVRHSALGDCEWLYDVWRAIGSPGA